MIIRVVRRGILVLCLLCFVVPKVSAQEPTPDDPVLRVMSRMPTKRLVGQMLLVSFPGTDVADDAELTALIRDYGIGGVLFRPENNNFDPAPIDPSELVSITNHLQSVAWDASQRNPLSEAQAPGFPMQPPYIPLLIAAESWGKSSLPLSSFISSTTQIPTAMALGATWDPAIAEAVGGALGRELASLGINLVLGPDLNVLYTPSPGASYDLGTQAFGGDPFWVGEIGNAYVQGLHTGGQGRLLVAPRHLPGLGSADRLLDEEVPTVQKSLSQLKQIELAPFFAVADGVPGDNGVADAFLVTHIRYRGLQGNIRFTTRPISLDAQALKLVTNQDEIAPWRNGGGLLIADNLGMKSIQRFYDPRGRSFNTRRVIQEAVLAGNDLMVVDRFAMDDSWQTHFSNVRDALDFLASRYETDPTLRSAVDEAVYRILSMKYRIYPSFSLDNVQVDAGTLDDTLGDVGVNTQVAMNAATLVFPFSEDVLPDTPQEGESIVIFTQEQDTQVGDVVEPSLLLSATDVPEALLKLYGPDGTGVLRPQFVRQFTFLQLQQALDLEATGEITGTAATVMASLEQAQWIIFATTGFKADAPDTLVLKTFLSQQVGLLGAHVVVLGFGPPYELDSTEMSKLDLYYAMYSPGAAFVETAVRALFRDLPTPGVSPVSIPGLNYDLTMQTMPDPSQVITLDLVDEAGETLTTTVPLGIGDIINLQTGTIVDQNGHPVPDGTPVQFTLAYPLEGFEQTVVAESQDGVGASSVVLDRVGQLNVTVSSEPALSSVRLELIIPEDQDTIIRLVTPTPLPTPFEPNTPTPLPPTPTPEPEPTIEHSLPESIHLPLPERALLLRWGIGGAVSVFALTLLLARGREMRTSSALWISLWGAIGGLCGYIVLVSLGRWWFPGWHYRIVGQEFLAGGISFICGVLTSGLAFVQQRLHISREIRLMAQPQEEV